MNKDIKILLEDIYEWMIENDYECGPRGSEIFEEITKLLEK